MTSREIAAFNAGVETVAALARATADRLATRLTEQPTRFNFAIGALDGVADGAKALLLSEAVKSFEPIDAAVPLPPMRCGDPASDGTPVTVPMA